jgi:drug/metabolite transporter (DMT)-like permease
MIRVGFCTGEARTANQGSHMLSNEVFFIVLLAAAMNAAWNSAVKIGGDRIAVMAVTTLIGSVLSLLVLPWITWPSTAATWVFLAGSIAIHTAYHFALPIAYNHGDLGQVYPIARGSAPLMVMAAAAVFAGEVPGQGALLGIACLCIGVLSLAVGRSGWRGSGKAVGWALLTGVLIAAYTVVDGLGARSAESAISFAVLLTVGDGVATALIVWWWKGARAFRLKDDAMRLCAFAAAMQLGACWLAVWALSRAPMGSVSALRETSVLFVALISTFLLKERLGALRLVSAAFVCGGIVFIRFGH